eukprot:m.74790 g.74790  ORF g.74790 m.74790 type:complete len:422 (+) comp24700_c0_seq1:1426-2691(+)
MEDFGNIDELIAKHADAVKHLLTTVDPELIKSGGDVGTKYDEIFALRFVLSNKSLKNALQNMSETIQYRSTIRGQNIIEYVHNGGGALCRPEFVMNRCQITAQFTHAIEGGGFLATFRHGRGNPNRIFDNLSVEENEDLQLLLRERAFQHCDKSTREKRRLNKLYLIFDIKDSKMADITEKRTLKVISAVSKMAETYYPQLLAKTIILNCPSWISALMVVARAFLPSKTVKKMCSFTTPEVMWNAEWVQGTFHKSGIPDDIGGELPVEQWAKTLTGELLVEEHPMTPVGVGAKSSVEIRHVCKTPGSLRYEIYCKDKEMGMSATHTCTKDQEDVVTEVQSEVKITLAQGPVTGSWQVGAGDVVITLVNGGKSTRNALYELTFTAASEPPTSEQDGDGSESTNMPLTNTDPVAPLTKQLSEL